MKILLFTVLFPLALIFSDQKINTTDSTHPDNETTELLNKKVDFELELVMGRVKKGCLGFGVCKVRLVPKVGKVLETGKVNATVTAQDGKISRIEFLKSSMNKETMKKYFSEGHFLVKDDFSTTIEHQGKKYLFNLESGKYKLERTKLGFTLGKGGVAD